jgi:hypothetical protein
MKNLNLSLSTLSIFISLILFCSSAFCAEREISVKGNVDFKIKINDQKISLKEAEFDGAQLLQEGDRWIIKDKAGKIKNWIKKLPSQDIELGVETEPALFKVKAGDQGYSVFTASDELLNRIKIKEDKFNLYNKDAKRLLHGKQKDDGFGVKDEAGTQLIKIKGVTSLKEASYFAVQFSPSYQVLLWAIEEQH